MFGAEPLRSACSIDLSIAFGKGEDDERACNEDPYRDG